MFHTALVANGQISSPDIIRPLILRHSQIIAVDGGLVHCDRMGIQPNLIVGDFDSCPNKLLQKYKNVPAIHLQTDKDETDLEVAIREAKSNDITLYAAWGHRIDHSLTNALLLTRHPGMRMETETEIVFAIDKEITLDCKPGQTLSLIPLAGPVTGINTSGLKWELKNGKLDQHFIGISNICLNEKVKISLNNGSLLCILIR